MIYYFSATGNSRHVATRLAHALDDQAVSIPQVLHEVIPVPSGERFIVVYPNYCGGVPSVVAEFLKRETSAWGGIPS